MDLPAQQPSDILFVGVDEIEESLVTLFLETPARLHHASNLDEAKEAILNYQPQLLICEAERPGLDVRKLCTDNDLANCIFLSSRDKDLEKRKCMLKIEDCYLTRPYSQEQLLNAVDVATHMPH